MAAPGGDVIGRAWQVTAGTAATVAGTAMLARVGLPVLGTVLGVAVIAAVVWCWTVARPERAHSAAEVIGAARGQLLQAAPVMAAGTPAPRKGWRRKNRTEERGRG
jgi:hypothetical protein